MLVFDCTLLRQGTYRTRGRGQVAKPNYRHEQLKKMKPVSEYRVGQFLVWTGPLVAYAGLPCLPFTSQQLNNRFAVGCKGDLHLDHDGSSRILAGSELNSLTPKRGMKLVERG